MSQFSGWGFVTSWGRRRLRHYHHQNCRQLRVHRDSGGTCRQCHSLYNCERVWLYNKIWAYTKVWAYTKGRVYLIANWTIVSMVVKKNKTLWGMDTIEYHSLIFQKFWVEDKVASCLYTVLAAGHGSGSAWGGKVGDKTPLHIPDVAKISRPCKKRKLYSPPTWQAGYEAKPVLHQRTAHSPCRHKECATQNCRCSHQKI